MLHPLTQSRSFDRFVVASLLGTKFQTPVAKKTLNPTYPPKDATFDFPIYLSLADKLGVVELVVWDKDVIKKDYLGEAWIPIEDWFRDGNAFPFNDSSNKVRFICCTSRARDRSLRTSVGSRFYLAAHFDTFALHAQLHACDRRRPSQARLRPSAQHHPVDGIRGDILRIGQEDAPESRIRTAG